MTKNAFSVLGGDMRQIWLAQMLAESGYIVKVCGFENSDFTFHESIILCCDIETAIKNSDYILLGLPCTHDGKLIFAPYSDKLLRLDALSEYMDSDKVLFAGKVPESIKTVWIDMNLCDYYDHEPLIIENAIPTAEGALQILLEELPVTVFGSQIAVTGFGRCGKVLADLLKATGAKVTVVARSAESRTWAATGGFTALDFDAFSQQIQNFDAIINTIPTEIFNAPLLSQANKNTLFIDLASKPGGFNMSAVSQHGLNLIWALSLPGKVAPKTAACAIKNTIFSLMKEGNL